MRRQCNRHASWNVVVYINVDVKPLVADNYDTSKVNHDYFVCGVHRNVLLRQHPQTPSSVWMAAATRLPSRRKGN